MNKSQLISIGLASAISLGSGVGFVAAKMAKSPANQPVATISPSPVEAAQPEQTPKPVAKPQPVETEKPKPRPVVSPKPERKTPTDKAVIQAVVDRQAKDKLCDFDFDRDTALRASEVFAKQDGIYLVRLACRMAAYQGVSVMVKVDTTQADWKIDSLKTEFAGFPDFDAKTQVISNTYKYNGVGTCVEHSKYYWNGYSLTLVSSELEDGKPNGCKEFGARSPESSFLITSNRVGAAKLGMTFGQLKQKLGTNATYQQVPLGVDMGYGMEVKQYGEVQFQVGFEDPRPASKQDPNSPFKITDSAVVSLVMVRNPNYRTQANIGPGTLLKQAEAKYGKASLAYNYENEGREYVQFQLQRSLIMRTNQGAITTFAGVYPKDTRKSSYQQTNRYHDHAAIGSIMIVKR